jgi:hypothetical protein
MKKKIEEMTIIELYQLREKVDMQIDVRKEIQSHRIAKMVQKYNPEIKYFGLNGRKIKI